jgi:Uma2 family endonuclease
MTTSTAPPLADLERIFPPDFVLPDHTTLPETDGTFVHNFQEHPQSMLLTDAIRPLLQQRHRDGQYCIGQDCGIYWNLEASLSDTPTRGAIAPDWFYVPNVSPLINGQIRRSYVLWREILPPLIVVEFVSGDGTEERDRTPFTGKFWIYEQFIRPAFYAIYEVQRGKVEVYHFVDGRYEPVPANTWGGCIIAPLNAALGIWQGRYQEQELPWLRWYDQTGKVLPTSEERAETERQRAETERQRAEQLAARLRALGIDPDEDVER